mgnify:CR=1 FL=1|jgi:kynurenine formamidase
MLLHFEWQGRGYSVQTSQAIDLSRAVDFDAEQPQFFGLPRAEQRSIEVPGFVGDTRRGGPCNCRTLSLSPHANGTHTESMQHIDAAAPGPAQAISQGLMVARLITLQPTSLAQSREHYNDCGEPQDEILSAAALKAALSDELLPQAVVLRSLPNTSDKLCQDYDTNWAPYLSFEAIDWLCQAGVLHLILDLPSIDRHDDGGELPNHHRFWQAMGASASITELAFVPQTALDGLYLLDLQLPNLLTDAVPSRPLIYPVTEA